MIFLMQVSQKMTVIYVLMYSFLTEFVLQVWRDISSESKSFVRHLLHTDPDVRPSARTALDHPWFTCPLLTFSTPGPAAQHQSSDRSVRSVGSSRSGNSSVHSLRVSGHRRVQLQHLEALSSDPEVAHML